MKYYKDMNNHCIGTSAITGGKIIISRIQHFKWNCKTGDKSILYGYSKYGKHWFSITKGGLLWDVFFHDESSTHMKELSEKEMFVEIL